MPNTTGLTSPHKHTKASRIPGLDLVLALIAIVLTPLFEWLDDRIEPGRFAAWIEDSTPSERVHAAVKAFLLVLLAVVAVTALAACKPTETIPGSGYQPSAVEIVPGPPPVPTATGQVNR